MVGYDTNHFMDLEYETVNYEDLIWKKLLPKRGTKLENVPEKLLVFYERLVATGWTCFAPEPY